MNKRIKQTCAIFIILLLIAFIFNWYVETPKTELTPFSSNTTETATRRLPSATTDEHQAISNQNLINQNSSTADSDNAVETNQTIDETNSQRNFTIKYDELALSEQLSEQQAYALSELSPENAAKLLNDDGEKLRQSLNLIQDLNRTDQRAFLLRVLQASNEVVQQQASETLLASDRVLDRKAAVALIMNFNNPDEKSMLSQAILQTEINEEVLIYTLIHMSSDEDKTLVSQSIDDLHALANHHSNPEIKGMALQAIMKTNPNNQTTFEQVSEFVNSTDPNLSFQGLNILHQQLNDFGIELSAEQKQDVIEQLTWIIEDNDQPDENRQEAKLSLDVLTNHY